MVLRFWCQLTWVFWPLLTLLIGSVMLASHLTSLTFKCLICKIGTGDTTCVVRLLWRLCCDMLGVMPDTWRHSVKINYYSSYFITTFIKLYNQDERISKAFGFSDSSENLIPSPVFPPRRLLPSSWLNACCWITLPFPTFWCWSKLRLKPVAFTVWKYKDK